MSRKSKRFKALLGKFDKQKRYELPEAVSLIKECANAKFDESIELHARLGVDPRHADQQVRSTIVLPHGTGHTKKVLVIAGEEKVAEIEGGWMDFDAVIATPDVMKVVGRLGKVLGPRGMMPSAKTNTVTFDVANAVKEIKAGRVEFRVDKAGIIHNAVGRASFTAEQLLDNIKTLVRAIVKARPSAVKGTYIRGMTISSTMGVGIKLEEALAQKETAGE